MTFGLREHDIRVVLLDIEGTTTPIRFVHEGLFPFAQRGLRSYVADHLDDPETHEAMQLLRGEWDDDQARGLGPPVWHDETRDRLIASIGDYCDWLMARDRKAPGLKLLQGLIWAQGYNEGTLQGEVFPDVVAAFVRWQRAGARIAIFSSGSVLAQRLLFQTTKYGDLTRFIEAFFDTGVGPKGSRDSYLRIARQLACPPERMVFVSDLPVELDAAVSAGFQAVLCVRPGNRPASSSLPVIADFDAIH